MQEIESIPNGLKIAIYGAGEVGLLIKHYVEKNRPDLEIICFFDKTVKADIEQVSVYSIKTIKTLEARLDLVIIASYSNISIMETILRHYGINNSLKLQNFYLHKSEDPDMVEECTLTDEFEKINQVQKILSSNQSRELFELVVNSHRCSHCFKKLVSYLNERNKKFNPQSYEQYLDFIDKASIKTIISAGAYDAGTSLLFLDRLKNVEKIYAFEPMYEKFKCEVNDSIIAESGKVEIIQKGLLDKSGETTFSEHDKASKVNTSAPWAYLETSHIIKTVSIDDFVEENSIKKIDFIKMDIEGCELSALKGAQATIQNHRPQLAICIYHSYNELFDIPVYLDSLLKGYRFEVYHYSLNSICESVLYGIPD